MHTWARIEFFKLVELQSGDGLEMAGILMVPLGRETSWWLLRSPGIELFRSVELYSGLDIILLVSRAMFGRWSWNCRALHVDTGSRVSVEVSWEGALWVSRVILRRKSWNGRPIGSDRGKDSTVTVGVLGLRALWIHRNVKQLSGDKWGMSLYVHCLVF